MVHLVGECPRQQALPLHLVERAIETLTADPDPLRPPGHPRISRYREASFLLGLAPPRFKDLRIGHHDQLAGLFTDGDVDHHQPHAHSDLGRREADPGSGVHRYHHVVHQLLPIPAEVFYGFGRRGEGRSPVAENRTDRQNGSRL